MVLRTKTGRFADGHTFTSEMLEKMSIAKKGKVTWNKGRKMSEESKSKMSIARIGKEPWNKSINTDVNKNLRTGEDKECPVCKNKFYVQKYLLENGRKKFCSKDCFFKGREIEHLAGRDHPAWVDGTHRSKYTSEFTPTLKKKIRERDNYTCQLCGMAEQEHKEKFNRVLAVNHIDFDKANCSEKNLNTLCTGCNTKINWNREYYKNLFQSKLD